jgi:tetratricopeptide (TPR) repeat protein
VPNSVFVSCVSDEFEKPAAPFPRLRSDLRHYLTRAKCHMIVQEDLPQAAEDTVEKLAQFIRESAAVLHLVGELPGAVAEPRAVTAYLKTEPNFLTDHPELKTALGNFQGITYTQWEAYLALHYSKPLFVYSTAKGDEAQSKHLERLRLCGRYAARIATPADLLGQLIGDIHGIIASVPKFTRKIASSRILRHSPDKLFGREKWLAALDAAWADPKLHVYTLVAWGGVGKTSLVAHWVSTRMAAKGWPGVERYFDWSFYSQGTGESRQTSSDLFIQEALKFCGDPDPIKGSPWERGERLAELIRQHRTLLVLDGIEPLQYPVNDPQAGRLKDQALEALLQGLAADNAGLCIVTTREHLKNIENQATTKEEKLDQLEKEAAIALLRYLQLVGTDEEMEAAWKAAGGHALTLQLLGRYIADAYADRDIRHYKEVKFEAADLERQGRSAFKVMVAYERWLQSAGPERQRELAILRLTGLFDRPMSRDCLQALRAKPAIPGLTDTLTKLKEPQWNIALKRLGDVDLLNVNKDAIDAHPLIREYFAKQLRETQPEAFREAHSQLFDYLCKNTPYQPDTLDGLQPLYQAVVHGCLAGRQQETRDKVYRDRILRGGEFFSTKKLGAIGADLAAVAAFFDEPWDRVSPNLHQDLHAWLLHHASYCLRALGRLSEARQPMRACLEMMTGMEVWDNAARAANNLSELDLTLGWLPETVEDARQAITHADQSRDVGLRVLIRTTAAEAWHQSGQRDKAGMLFAEAEQMQKYFQPDFNLLYSLQGFRYCDWLMAPTECAAYQALLRAPDILHASKPSGQDDPARICAEVERRGTTTLMWGKQFASLLSMALEHLTLARVGLMRAMLAHPLPQPSLSLPHVTAAVAGLRNAGMMDHLAKGLLTAALYHFVRGEPDAARARLAEAQQIAERGPMPLYLADVHLHRARFFRDKEELAMARDLIVKHGYGRRNEELADAEEAARNWPG